MIEQNKLYYEDDDEWFDSHYVVFDWDWVEGKPITRILDIDKKFLRGRK